MEDQSKTKKVLIQELDSLRQRIAELEQSELERQQAEKTLHDFERRLRLVFEHSSDVIYTLDCDFRVTSVSPSVERYLGYRTEELVGKPFNDINVLAPESLEAAFKDALQTLAGGTVPTAEYVFIRKDGSRVIGEVSGSPLVEDGKIVGLISVARNITDRKRAEGALRDNETKLQAIFNAVGTGILIIDRDTQIIIEANQTAIEMTGLTKERIIGQICHSLVCPAQAGKCPVKDLGQSVDNSERKLIHADGHLKDILKTVYPITIKGRDCYVESFIDITDRKRAEEALRESEEKFRVLADSTPTAVMLYQDDLWVYANRVAETICGYSEKELLAMNFWDIVHPDFKPLIQERGRKRQRGEETTDRYEFKIIMKDGTEKWADLSGASTMLRGRPAGIISVLDITERKRVESIMQARLRLLEFANSHSMDEFLTATLDEIEALTGSTIGFYHFLESDQKTLSLQNWSTNTLKTMCTSEGKGSHYGIAQAGVWVDCVYERRPVIHNDYASLPHRKGMPEGHAPVVREVVVPIFRDNLIRAIIGIGNKSTNYDESDIGIVSQLGDLSWDITERKREEEELSRVNRALRMLSYTNQALIHITDEAMLLNEVCRISVEVGGYRMAWVGFAEHDEAKTLRPVAHAGFDSGYIESANVSWADNERGRGPGGIAIRTGQPYMARNISVDPAFAPWREAAIQRGYKSIIALPLISEGQTLGVLGIYSSETNAFDAKEVEILKELADDLAFGIIALRTRAKRDQAEEALHESEERYRLIAENTADTITVLDLSLNPIYVSPSVLKLRGYTVQEEMAQSLDQILTPESQQKAKNLFAEQMALESSGKADPARTALIELEEYCKDGSTIWVELAASFLRDNNFKPTGILTVTRNITERKKAEKEKEKLMSQLVQAQKMEAIGTLAGGIAHDFNNILGALIGYTELAIGESREEKKQYHLEQVLKACDRAKNLVKQILSFSRQREKELKPIDIGIIAKEALKLLRASLPTTIEIRQRITTVPAMVFADPTWIHQILMNFCTNAAHAMREKGGLLTVSLSNVNISPDTPPINPYLQAGHYVQMTVSDTGHGINPAFMDRIFDPFFTTKDEGEGTGLGLSVVYGIVNSLGGTITVQSEPGKGAAFDVYLPLIDAGMDRKAERISQVLPTGTERILFVDDEESLREIMKAMLQSLGYDVVATSSSEEALKLFLEKPERFDLVITDMTMPHMTGVELAKKLMEMRPGLPIILSTGFSQRISEDKAMDIGVRKFLMKPVSMTDLALSVRAVMDDVKKRG